MKNVLFIGPYRQIDEWGNRSFDYLQSLSLVPNFNIVSRPIYYNYDPNLYRGQVKTETADTRDFDIVIQHTLPDMSRIFGNVKNVFIYERETLGWDNSSWNHNLTLFDDTWTPEQIGVAIDQNKTYTPQQLQYNKNLFTFYSFTSNKETIFSILLSYYATFKGNNEVQLILNPTFGSEELNGLVQEALQRTCLKPDSQLIPKLSCISNKIPEEIKNQIHDECDCFIDIDSSIMINRDTLKAALFHKPIITNSLSPTNKYIASKTLCTSRHERCFVSDRPRLDLLTDSELIIKPDLNSLCEQMYTIFNDLHFRLQLQKLPIIDTTYENQAIKMELLLCTK